MRLQDIVALFEGQHADKHDVEVSLGDLREWAAENARLRAALDHDTMMHRDEIERLRADRDNWEAVCSGSLKEQFRLARENEARLKLALDQLDKAAAEIERLRATLQYVEDNSSEPEIAGYAGRALEQARKEC